MSYGRLQTSEVSLAIVCAIMFASQAIIPFDSQPFARSAFYSSKITYSTQLPFQTQALTNIMLYSCV